MRQSGALSDRRGAGRNAASNPIRPHMGAARLARRLALASCLLLGGCLEGLEHPDALRFEDANVGESPAPIPFTVASLLDEPVALRAHSWTPEWLSTDRTRLTIEPGGSGTVTLSAAECGEGGEREGVLAISANGKAAFIRVDMTCAALGPDARFGDVAAHQGARIGPTEFNPRLEIPVVNDRPGAFRAEVLATFDPTAHIEVEAVVLGADGKPVPGLSPLERLREPVEFDHGTAPYAAVHEFKAPATAFGEDVEVVLRIDPDRRLGEDALDNNEARPLEGAPRLPEPLPSFIYHFVPVTMTVVRDGMEHALTTGVPDCPAGCLSGTLDMLPLPVGLVEVRERPIDIGVLEWTAEHEGERYGMTWDVRNKIWDGVKNMGILDMDVPAERQTVVAFVPDSDDADWSRNAFSGLSGNPILIVHNDALDARSFTPDHAEDGRGFSSRSTIAHEAGHNFGAYHAWVESEPICRNSRGSDPDFPYSRNGTPYTPFISGDPDGDGPLRIRPAYARLGTAGRLSYWTGYTMPSGFLDQTVPAFEVMACASGVGDVHHVSDYHYLLALHGAGLAAGLPWADRSCMKRAEWSDGRRRWAVSGTECPWRSGGGAARASARSKSAGAPSPAKAGDARGFGRRPRPDRLRRQRHGGA